MSDKVEKLKVLIVLCRVCETFEVLENKNVSTAVAVELQLAFVGDVCCFAFGKCLDMTQKNEWSKISPFLTKLEINCEPFRELDGPKAPDNLSSYASRL